MYFTNCSIGPQTGGENRRWAHKGTCGWQVASGAGGANVNRLMSSAAEDLEKLAGMARLTGVPVRVDRLSVKPAAPLQN
jgi:hypothetical protein